VALMARFEPNPVARPAIVTGASSGIGAATARALAAAGHPVALGARRAEVCTALASEIEQAGGRAVGLALDVAADSSVTEFVARATEALGPIEILVSGAGDLEVGLVHETDPGSFAHQVNVHLVGAQRVVAAVVPGMVERQRGDVVFIGSDVVPVPRPRAGAYGGAKAAVEAMARQLRMELEGTGVRASIVRPGPTSTGMGMDLDAAHVGPLLEDWTHWGIARHPYFLRASDIADAILTVVSAPRGVHIALIELQPEAPLKSSPLREQE
jgi:NADP-dependent 3-hydroxy acid dehydrogenase YdfG